MAIFSWVADNIYYDYDAFFSGNYGRTDAIGTLQTKRSVCQGYSELTDALMKSAGIPSRLVSGFALGFGYQAKSWDDVDHTKTNHAWNEVYINGRWVIMDTTWSSNNIYSNGEYHYEGGSYRFFDPTLDNFSHTHKIMNY